VFDIVVVANRLPVDRQEGPDGEVIWSPSPGGLVTALRPVMQANDGAWVGWPGSHGEAPEPFESDGITLVAVSLSEGETERFYEGMSNATIWPLYHDVIVPPGFHRAWWDSYVKVNQRFAEKAAEVAAEGAVVWVQDYQLQLVPRQLRKLRPDLKIGFFNHIPFPPFEIFAQLPWRRQVVDGLLGADLLGFQRPADANNFLRACRRMGLHTRRASVIVEDVVSDGNEAEVEVRATREVRVHAFPISIDAKAFDELARSPEVMARAREIRQELGDPELVLLGVDRLDYTKGIRHRLKAVGELFEDGRLTVPGAVLVQVATPSRERVEQYQQMRDEVEITVSRINGRHSQLGHPAVHYLHQSVDRSELIALYQAADVMLVTALRDGMNLVAKEYLAARHDEGGALVLSEFAGAANELGQAWLVNPHDIDEMKDVIIAAANADPRDSRRRMWAMRKRVFGHDVQQWASSFLTTLETQPATPAWSTAQPNPVADISADLAAALDEFVKRDQVLIATDFDGVLAPIVSDPDAATPLPSSVHALGALTAADGVTVALVSGREIADLRKVASPPAGALLVGSHGAQVSDPQDGDDAQTPLDRTQTGLLRLVGDELDQIAGHYPGANVERKPTSAVLHTRRASRADAARATTRALEGPAARPGVHLTQGKEVVELAVVTATKGAALNLLRDRLGLAFRTGGVLYIGDDVTDERAFAVLDDDSGDVTIKVGPGQTQARHRIEGPEDVSTLLEYLAARLGPS
jgi:trehalose 6-phosphate synthase/phosphatase